MIQFTDTSKAVMAEIERMAKIRVLDGANIVRNEWVQVLSGNRSGRVYRIPGTKRTYTASAPGEAPGVLFGDLRRSIRIGQPEIKNGETSIEIGSELEKAVWLELGTKKMRARPHAKPAADRATPAVKAAIETVWF
jgi:hypothetical protein